MLCLVARYEDQVIRWPVPKDGARLGSDAGNEIVVPFPGVSRVHASVVPTPGGLKVVDAGSKNGILAGSSRVSEVVLTEGEWVRIGRALLGLEDARTSDVELVAQPRQARTNGTAATTHEEQRSDGAGAVVSLIRQIEAGGTKFSGRKRQMFLESCRGLLGAVAVAMFNVRLDGEVHLISLAGRLPDDDSVLAAPAQGARKRAWAAMSRPAGRFTTVTAGRSSTWVTAIVDAAPPAWAEDFVGYVAEKLIPHAESTSPADDAGELVVEGSLVIPPGMVVGTSDAMKALLRNIAATIASRMDVLLLGETGTGKELFARMIHASGSHSAGPFVAINCAAIPSELLESELFGVQARVATGVDPRTGLFVQANNGSILLDEIGEMPERLQAKLLRVLQEREVLPVGAPVPRKIDVRVISASNCDLFGSVADGRFRADLYYRLRGLQFHIPPLRERKDDIPALVFEFVNRACDEYKKDVRGVSRRALNVLLQHDWPGNVRELESEVRRAVLVCPNGNALQSEHLGSVRWMVDSRAAASTPAAVSPAEENGQPELPETPEPPSDPAATLQSRVDATERVAIEEALRASGGNHSLAARRLGITRNGLAMKMRRLGMKKPE